QLLKGALEAVKTQQQKHWLEKPTIEEDETPERLIELLNEIEAEISKNNERIFIINNQISENENQRKRFCELKKKMDLLNVERQQWAHLCRLFGDAEGKSFRKIAQCYVLRELLVHANSYLKYLSKRYELHCQNDSLTILVSDSYFGGIARPVDLVSGGESFVVSLALALGLSSLNHNSFATDILFIDEGFGTLDADTLEIVMDTLSRLRDIGGRRVGIISHVEQLRERIAAKISVERITNNSSRVRMEVS
ncbi:MAG: SbcC/MukB-like Walker B domain-containing protein, partial [Bacteroidales bacterium]|nr:SbcC/MukB-like Walker B domain-containing protein [Bacteroidales bacterium]